MTDVNIVYTAMCNDRTLDMCQHLPLLKSLATGDVLEIGVHCGISTTALLAGLEDNGGHLWSIDQHTSCRYVWFGHEQHTFICADSHTFDFLDQDRQFNLVLIDGDHSYDGCMVDLERWSKKLKYGGILLCHDVEAPDFPGVRKAVDDFCNKYSLNHSTRSGSFGMEEILWYRF